MTKQQQLDIILASNPADKDLGYHTWIRSIDDILTFQEAVNFDGGDVAPDFTEDDAQNALQYGKITVYSSYPIKQGTFVTPSKMIAQEYAGGRNANVYQKLVQLDEVAWIDSEQGQYTGIGTINNKSSMKVYPLLSTFHDVNGNRDIPIVVEVFSTYKKAFDYAVMLAQEEIRNTSYITDVDIYPSIKYVANELQGYVNTYAANGNIVLGMSIWAETVE